MATILPVMALVKSNTDSKGMAAASTIDVEIFEGEICRGLNFQEIKFLWMVAPQNFEPNKNFVVENFYTCKAVTGQSHSTRRLSAYVDTTYTRTFGK